MWKPLRCGRKTLKMKEVSWVIATLISSLAVCTFVPFHLTDSHIRELAGKYSHAAVWPILAGYEKSDGSRGYPLASMVANLAKPTPEKPALMRHDDVVTFFHEMGHVFHGLLSKTKFARFHGTRCAHSSLFVIRGSSPSSSVARDFVEAPSQMLENWCWEPKVLKLMSSHYKTQQPLSPDLIDKIIKRLVIIVFAPQRTKWICLLAVTWMLALITCDSCSLPSLISRSISIKVCHQLHFE